MPIQMGSQIRLMRKQPTNKFRKQPISLLTKRHYLFNFFNQILT